MNMEMVILASIPFSALLFYQEQPDSWYFRHPGQFCPKTSAAAVFYALSATHNVSSLGLPVFSPTDQNSSGYSFVPPILAFAPYMDVFTLCIINEEFGQVKLIAT